MEKRGLLVLNRVPPERSDELAAYLSRFVGGNGQNKENIKALLQKAPLILKREIDERAAQELIQQLSLFEAEVIFVPKKGQGTPPPTSESPPPTQEGRSTRDRPLEKPKTQKSEKVEDTASASPSREPSFFSEEDPILENLLHSQKAPEARKPCERRLCQRFLDRLKEEFYKVNKELWLILSLVSLTAFMNYLVDSQKLLERRGVCQSNKRKRW